MVPFPSLASHQHAMIFRYLQINLSYVLILREFLKEKTYSKHGVFTIFLVMFSDPASIVRHVAKIGALDFGSGGLRIGP